VRLKEFRDALTLALYPSRDAWAKAFKSEVANKLGRAINGSSSLEGVRIEMVEFEYAERRRTDRVDR